jgi:hypothetical protein
MLYEIIISIMKHMAIHMPYLSQILPSSMNSPEDVCQIHA